MERDDLFRIGKTYRFEASHELPLHDGKCRNLHGHSYEVEIEFVGGLQSSGSKSGMVIDFYDISQVWKSELEPRLDHRYLNESLDGEIPQTTAELLAWWIFQKFEEGGIRPDLVRVRETATSVAQFPA